MKNLHSGPKRTGYLFIILITVILASSCLTTMQTSPKEEKKDSGSRFDKLEPKEQNLSERELKDIELWNSREQTIFIQNHLLPTEGNKSRIYNPWLASYEGFRMASLFGFDKDLSTDEIYLFIQAMFEEMPMEVEVGSLVKSIVIKNWYNNGSPLVLNLTRAFSGDKIPVAVFMFNTWDNLRNYGLPIIKSAGIAFEYPRLKTPEGKFQQEFMDSYSISWLEDGFVTASNMIGKVDRLH